MTKGRFSAGTPLGRTRYAGMTSPSREVYRTNFSGARSVKGDAVSAVEELGLPRSPVEKVPRPGVDVARDPDERDVLVKRRRAERVLSGREGLFHLLPLAGKALLMRIQAEPVAGVDRGQELIG